MNEKKEQYIWHVTTTTGNSYKSPKSKADHKLIQMMKVWLEKMKKGELYAMSKKGHVCRVGMQNSKSIEFIISRLDDNFNHTDLVRFVVCDHSRKKYPAWQLVGGTGEPPNLPFCAVQLLTSNVIQDDVSELPLFADFERYMAWAWLEQRQETKARSKGAENE